MPQGAAAPEEYKPRFRAMARAAGRPELPVTLGHAPEDLDQLRYFRDLGIARMQIRLPAEPAYRILPSSTAGLGSAD